MLCHFASRTGRLTTWQETRKGGRVGGDVRGIYPRNHESGRVGGDVRGIYPRNHERDETHEKGAMTREIRIIGGLLRRPSGVGIRLWSHCLEGWAGRSVRGDKSRSRTLVYKRLKMLQECKKVQKNRTVESGLERGDAGRMSFGDLLIGSAMHRLSPSRQGFALNGRKCNQKSPVLFTMSD